MNKFASLALTIGGIILIIYGINAADSLSSDVSRFFSGSPTDETIWLLIGGFVMLVAGSGGLLIRRKNS